MTENGSQGIVSPTKKIKVDMRCGDSTENAPDIVEKQSFKFSEDPSLEKIRQMQADFCKERNWDQYHSPRNILLAMVGEVGELAEIFQWKGEVKEGLPEFSEKEREHVAQEMSDVLVYLVRLADRCRIDLPSAVIDKVEQNRLKYPVEKVFGKSDKYTAYK